MRVIVGLATFSAAAFATSATWRTGITDDIIGAAVLIAAATPAAAVEIPIGVDIAVDVLILILDLIAIDI